MSYDPTYKAGDWLAVCDSCGKKLKASELQKRWDGFMVCSDDFELRHPSDFIRTPQDQKPLPWTRPEPADQFVGPTYIATTVGKQDQTLPTVINSNNHGDL